MLLYAAIAVMAPPPEASVTPMICALRRTLPGLGFAFSFVGLVLQLVHDLDKNVYTVNPERFSAWLCGMSKSNGLLVVGMIMSSVQVILLTTWIGVKPPNVVCTPKLGSYECNAMLNLESHYLFSFAYPVLLGILICALSGVSLKWKTNSGATWNLLALTVTFVAWAVTGAVQTLAGKY